MLIDLFINMIVVVILLVLLVLISGELHEDDYLGVYECGFDSLIETRLWFSYRFFLLGVLFIVFDVEISLLLMLPYTEVGSVYILLLVVFMIILLGGTMYEIEVGSMEWV